MKNYKGINETFISLNQVDYNGYSIECYDNSYSLINFSPGPAPISINVLNTIKDELFTNSKYVFGNTPLEMSHRSPQFMNIINNVNNKIRTLMEISNDFEIIWTQAGGHGQFSAIPLNMRTLQNFKKGGYLVNGTWSSRAYNESKKFISSQNILENFYQQQKIMEYKSQPQLFDIPNDLDYVYLCSNETVNGLEYKQYLSRHQLKGAKQIVDMSSDFLMKKIHWDNIDIAFACTSKNMGVAGANILIIRKHLLEQISVNDIPCVLSWKLYSEANSLYNTPAVFNIYLLEKIIDNYVSEMLNIENIYNNSIEKAKIFYDFLDNNTLFSPVVKDLSSRSIVNIPFIVGDGNHIIMSKFLEYSYLHNIVGLRTLTPFSYKSMGLIEPLRISLYNGISLDDVKQLIIAMKIFIMLQ